MLSDEEIHGIFYPMGGASDDQLQIALGCARAIESAATAPLLARIAELTRELEEARNDEREHWENACRLMLVARSGQITDMALAERLVGLISEDRKEKQAIRAAIKEQT